MFAWIGWRGGVRSADWSPGDGMIPRGWEVAGTGQGSLVTKFPLGLSRAGCPRADSRWEKHTHTEEVHGDRKGLGWLNLLDYSDVVPRSCTTPQDRSQSREGAWAEGDGPLCPHFS